MPTLESTVVESRTDLPDLLTQFHEFRQVKCCGKCIPCREATDHICIILARTTVGESRPGDELILEELGDLMAAMSKCRLGKEVGKSLVAALWERPTIRSTPERYASTVALAVGG